MRFTIKPLNHCKFYYTQYCQPITSPLAQYFTLCHARQSLSHVESHDSANLERLWRNSSDRLSYHKALKKTHHKIGILLAKPEDMRCFGIRYDLCSHTLFWAIFIPPSYAFYLNPPVSSPAALRQDCKTDNRMCFHH